VSVGLVYGKITGLLRKIVIPDTDAQIPLHVGRGEAVIIASNAQYNSLTSLDAVQAFVNAAVGTTPSGYRSAMIDTVGNVISIHHADAGCDVPFPGKTLVWNDSVELGWLLAGKRFVPFPGSPRRVWKSPRLLRQL